MARIRIDDPLNPCLIGVARAAEALGLNRTITHAGPPIRWSFMPGPLQYALVMALALEGVVTPSELREIMSLPTDVKKEACAHVLSAAVDNGSWTIGSNWDLGMVAPLTGVVSPSMAVWQVRDEQSGLVTTVPVNEGPGPSMRFGTVHSAVLDRQSWLSTEFLAEMSKILQGDPLPLWDIAEHGLENGDELHMRTVAASQKFHRVAVRRGLSTSSVGQFLKDNPGTFLNLAMGMAGNYLRYWERYGPSGTVVAIGANGRDFGVRCRENPGQWLLNPVPSPMVSRIGTGPLMGDSFVLEVLGLGGRIPQYAPKLWPQIGHGPWSDTPGAFMERRLRRSGSLLTLGLRCPEVGQTFYHSAAIGAEGTYLGVIRGQMPKFHNG